MSDDEFLEIMSQPLSQEIEIDIENAERVVKAWFDARLKRAEAFAEMVNIKLDADGICAGALKDFADLESKNMNGLMTKFANAMSELGAGKSHLETTVARYKAAVEALVAGLEHFADDSRWIRSATPEDGGKYLNCEYDWEHSGSDLAQTKLNEARQILQEGKDGRN